MKKSEYFVALEGTVHSLKRVFLIGRDPRCDLVIKDPGVSRVHATLILDQFTEEYQIIDGDLMSQRASRNGLKINTSIVDQSAFLKSGDIISICDHEIIYSVHTLDDDSNNGTIS